MRIGLYNLEPKIINVAMMKVSTYYKSIGDVVEIYNSNIEYDKVYAFSIFSFTDKSAITPNMICGGTGFDITSKLPDEIESCEYDWSLFPECDYSIIWFSKGCIRNCSWCVVRAKEGLIHSVAPKNLNPKGTHIKVMDNNFFANPEWRSAIKQLQDWKQPVDFQGVDIRLMDEEKCLALKSLKHYKQIKIAWDNPADNIVDKIKDVLKHIKAYRFMCYVLIGYNSTKEEDLFRVKTLDALGLDPFVMPYDKNDPYQKKFARWVNRRQIFKTCTWEEFQKGKNI